MSSETFSILVRCWHDLQSDTTYLQLVRVDTGEKVHLKDGFFLLRVSRNENSSVERCLIRHLASGHEAYVQGGSRLRAFIKACLLGESGSEPTDPAAPGV
jgi:hypothetical protein